MPPITDLEFDTELTALLHEMEASQQLVAMLMVVDDVWQPISNELHDEVVARLHQERRDSRD